MKEMEGLSPEDVLALQHAWEEIERIDLSALEKEKEARKTGMERLLEDVKLGKKLERKFGEKRPVGRPKLHWKTKIARRAATKRKYYQDTWKPRRTAEIVSNLETCEGWYKHITRLWKGEVFGPKQWEKHLWPLLEGRVPVFKRVDTKKGWTLDNVMMFESGTRNMLYCPEDLKLKKLGAIL